MNFIAMSNQPFTEEKGFIELIAHLQPKYLIPSRKYFVEKMLPTSYRKLRSAVFEKLSKAD